MPKSMEPSTPLEKLCNLYGNFRQRGPVNAAALYAYRIHEKYRDWRLGIRTAGDIDASDLGLGAECVQYQPVNYRCLDVMFSHLDICENDVFLDYGCGKGRAVIVAAMNPLGRVIGVELSPELSKAARENVDRAACRLACSDVEVVTTDASGYKVPRDVTVVFLFNPFTGSILTAVQQKIYESILDAPRRVRIVYMHPTKQENAFDSLPWLSEPCELPTADWKDVRLLVYEANVPPISVEGRDPTQNAH